MLSHHSLPTNTPNEHQEEDIMVVKNLLIKLNNLPSKEQNKFFMQITPMYKHFLEQLQMCVPMLRLWNQEILFWVWICPMEVT
jgi:hypothetical protein